MTDDCPFCVIQTSGDGRKVLARGEHVIAMLSDPRLAAGHTLVIPRRHVSALSELTPEERSELFETAIRFQERIKRVVAPGCDLSQHDRPFMSKSAFSVPEHAHVHLRPCSWQDDYYQRVLKHETEVFQPLVREEADFFQEMLAE